MNEIPSRGDLAAIVSEAARIVPAVAAGFIRARPDGQISIFSALPASISEHIVPPAEIAEALLPAAGEMAYLDESWLRAEPNEPVEWQLTLAGAHGVVALPVDGWHEPVRFFVGVSVDRHPDSEAIEALRVLAWRSIDTMYRPMTQEVAVEQLRRLELVAHLLPTLLTVLDVREVFDQLSTISQAALPHDMLTLGLFNDELKTMTFYAGTGQHQELGKILPQPYPQAVTQSWNFDIIDDRTEYPVERDRSPTKLGMRSSLRIAFRFNGRVTGGIGFHSREVGRFSNVDLPIARRLSEHVAVAVAHHQMAEQARRAAELQALTTNLELLDELLGALIDSGGLRETFERISEIAGKVLPHDAAALLVRLPDGEHHLAYAIKGFPATAPEITKIPGELLSNPEWEHDIFDDVRTRDASYAGLAEMGFHSLLRVPIRLEGRFAGALIFASKPTSAFKQTDVLAARRIADRMAVTLARERTVEASKRADEAVARAAQLEARVRALTDELDARTGYRRVIGESQQWRQVLTQAAQVAATDTTVLLLGESGTGKEVVARFVHRGSPRTNGPFIALNCAALPEHLLEAELFGYERGAFTGATQSKPGQLEQAAGGTLFLDEVGEMSLSAQAKFLRVLQEKEFQRLGGTRVLRTDARIVAATNRDLQKGIAQGQFREDLYYRLNVFAIRLPALRDRKDDVLPLSEAFLKEIGRGLGRPPGGISREARQQLMAYHWPGNVRELRNILERAAILCDGSLISTEHLALTVAAQPVSQPVASGAAVPQSRQSPPVSAKDLQSMERTMIEEALQNTRFNKSKAAKALGLTRHQLYLRMRKYGFD